MKRNLKNRKTPVTALAFSIAVALHAPAFAQSQETSPTPPVATDLDRVEVVGTFRASLEKALEEKRYSAEQIDAVVAEDIGKFPDLNLAEALQRIPGVAIDRDAGEGRSITVRGLGQDFTRVRINGLEALATTGGTDSSGGANRGRGFDFNVFAAELFSKLTVRKTQSAQIDEGSLGATVDLRAARPFDYDGFTSTVTSQMGYNDLSKQWDPRFSALISNTWADGKFGALLSAAYSERNLLEEGYSAVRWDNGPSANGFCSPVGYTPQNNANNGGRGTTALNCSTGNPRPANTQANNDAYRLASATTTFHPRLPRYGRLTHEQERLGVTAALQFKPSDRTLLSFDAMYSKLDATRQEDFLETISFSRSNTQGGKYETHVLQAEVDDRGNLVYGVFDNVDVRSESRFDELSTEFSQYSLSLEQDITDRLKLNAMVGTSTSEFKNPVQTTVTFDIQNLDGYSWDYRGNSRLPVITYGSLDVNSPSSWRWISSPAANTTGSEIRIRPQGVDNTFDTGKLDLDFVINETFTLRGGMSYKKFGMDTWEFRRGNETLVPALPTGTTLGDLSSLVTGFGRGLDGRAPGSWLIPDLDAIASLFNIYCNCNTGVPGGDFTLSSITNGNARGNNRSISEEDWGGYLQLDFNADLAGRPMRGNVGVRYATTDVDASGYTSVGGGSPVTASNDYKDWLPSLNLAWDVTDDMVLRFGAAKVMARPQLGNLSPGAGITTTGSPNIRVGNPHLAPFRAKTYDFSAEWYFAEDSVLSLALFYKDIETYIQELRENIAYRDTGFPLEWVPSTFWDEPFDVRTPINTPGGPLKGFELNYQQPFSFLPGGFRHFGVLLNYTHVKSDIDYAVPGSFPVNYIADELVNLSPKSYNATLYYDNNKFSARISTSFRDDYLQRVPGQNNNDVEGKRSARSVDFSMSYKWDKHFTLTFEGINLTDEFNDQYVDSVGDRASVYHHTGRQYYVGARFNF
jgi:iron complex outermembrane receptor protein